MLAVHEDEEEEWDNIQFGMRILKSTKTKFERQILESVMIQKARSHNIMNNKAEYNRCALLRLTAKLGERDLEKWREEDRLEQAREATIEEKIRLRKKEKAKKRGDANRRMEKGQSARKRRKVSREQEGGKETQDSMATPETEERQHQRVGKTSTPKKRKVGEEERRTPSKTPKKKRKNADMKR
jgi:hypothetical protein